MSVQAMQLELVDQSGVLPTVGPLDEPVDLIFEPEPEPTCFYAGWMPHLPSVPGPTPGYTTPPKRLPPDNSVDEVERIRVFGFLRVTHMARRGTNGGAVWACVCERPVRVKGGPGGFHMRPCGNTKDIPTSQLLRGEIRSCGCWSKARGRK